MPLKCVPFNSDWVTNDKLDIRAIYRRPQVDEFGNQKRDTEHHLLWDLTGPLPIRRHSDWGKKGFEYVTLADMDSLSKVAGSLQAQGYDWREFIQEKRRTRPMGPWNLDLYLEGQAELTKATDAELRAMVEQFGSEAVQKIRRSSDPTFVLPPDLRDVPARNTAAAQPATAKADTAKVGETAGRGQTGKATKADTKAGGAEGDAELIGAFKG